MRYLGKPLFIVFLMVFLTGCGNKGSITREMYDELAKEIETSQGVRVDELESEFMSFIHHVYNPNTTEEIEKGIESISEYLTESVERDFRGMIVEVDTERSSSISDVDVRYSGEGNNTDGLARIYTEFNLQVEGLQQKKAIEFVFNPEGKIFRYYFWEGILKTDEE